jgi:hypothetical protein
VFLGFFKYVGYLAFPIQMAYRYPVLARFMAAHWATGAVHVVPVFGEHGALLEHGVFDLFYNYPLTLRRRLREKARLRASLPPRRVHAAALALLAAAAWVGCAAGWQRVTGSAIVRADEGGLMLTASLRALWPAVILLPALAGGLTSLFAGGLSSARRTLLAVLCGAAAGGIGSGIVLAMHADVLASIPPAQQAWQGSMYVLWRIFVFALTATLGAAIAETRPLRRGAISPSAAPAAETPGL